MKELSLKEIGTMTRNQYLEFPLKVAVLGGDIAIYFLYTNGDKGVYGTFCESNAFINSYMDELGNPYVGQIVSVDNRRGHFTYLMYDITPSACPEMERLRLLSECLKFHPKC